MTRYPVSKLLAFVRLVLQQHGVPFDDAEVAARRMLDADVRGMSGHGVFRLPQYVARLQAGGYNVRPDIRATHETPVSALVEGDNGIGQVVLTRAADIAIKKAAEHGVAWVGVRGSNHAGAAGVYASMALEHDLIGVYLAVGSSNHLPPWGGTDPLLSTNPLAVAIPAGLEAPIVLDMATTVVSYGRIKIARDQGETLPEGWMVDRTGAPLTDPNRSGEGFLVPIGGYKGYGLGLVIGMLAGVLNGAAFGSRVVDFTQDHDTPTNTGQTLVMVRPDLFQPLEAFKVEMDERIRELRSSTPMPGQPPVRVPGDQMPRRQRAAAEHGLTLPPGTANRLRELAERLGITDHPFPAATSDGA
ncbi:Ldh family oxidoreductase [Qaidamihabitans albus]|uniref:Ldh family oxidoreductase n=1 Tax=Qaidamihabitans albus TaxID=2795733 RepID=UPI0018F11713|nr:Ldh family oxidoreductase [Qaidamihabitans albus]